MFWIMHDFGEKAYPLKARDLKRWTIDVEGNVYVKWYWVIVHLVVEIVVVSVRA